MKSHNLKVLLLVDVATFHGQRIAAQLKLQGVKLLVASLEQGPIRYLSVKRIGPFKSLHYALAIPRIRTVVKRFKPDIIYAHYASGYGFVAAGAAMRKGPPVVLNLWGSDILRVPQKSFLHRLKTRIALKAANFVLADSEYLLQEARKLSRLKASEVMYWGIEEKYLGLHKEKYDFERPVRVIVPRAHEPVYNNLFIVESLKEQIDAGDIQLTFPGFGSGTESFKKLAHQLVEDRLIYYDRMPRPEFMKFMSQQDIYLSAALTDSSPMSLIEAMALGLLPVCADIEGIREWLSDTGGFRFRQNDKNDLKSVVNRLIHESNPYEAMRRENLQRVRRDAIFEDNVARQIKIMRNLTGKA